MTKQTKKKLAEIAKEFLGVEKNSSDILLTKCQIEEALVAAYESGKEEVITNSTKKVSHRELAEFLGVTANAIGKYRNKKKKLLMLVGLHNLKEANDDRLR